MQTLYAFQIEKFTKMEENDQEIKLQNEVSWCIEKLSDSISQGKLSEKKGNGNFLVND